MLDPVPPTRPLPPAPMARPSRLLRAKVAGVRRKLLVVALLAGLATLVIVGPAFLALVMFFDWWFELPWGARCLALAAQGAVLAWLFLRLIARPLARPAPDDEVALLVEKSRPEFRGRLIAAIQLTRPGAIPPGASAAMVEALVEQTEALAQGVDFPALVPTERLKKSGLLALFLVAVFCAGLVGGRAITVDLLKRAWLARVPVPRQTRVVVPHAEQVVGRGDNVLLAASARGLVPAAGTVTLKYRGRRNQEFPLLPDRRERGSFARTIENVQDSFSYQVRLHDGASPWHTVKVISRPTVAGIVCRQDFPAYTGLKPARRMLGDLSLLAGSRLRLQVAATKDVRGGAIKCSGLDQSVPMQVNPKNPRELTGELPIPARGLNGFSIQMRDTDGMDSRDTAIYRVEVIPDKAPAVRLTYPDRKEELVTRQATLIVGLEIFDDFAIDNVRLRYKVDPVDQGAEKTVELDMQGEHPQRLRRRHEWRLGAWEPLLKEGSRIEFWIEAADNNNATGPGLGASEHHFARIVSEEEKRADLLNRAGDYLGSINDLATDEEKLNRNLGALIREKILPK